MADWASLQTNSTNWIRQNKFKSISIQRACVDNRNPTNDKMLVDLRLAFAVVYCAYFVATAVWAYWSAAVDLNHFTWWAYTLQALVSPLLIVAVFWRGFRRVLLRWYYPLWWGTAWVVYVFSSFMIGNNGNIFLRNTVAATPPGTMTVGAAHTGDFLVHQLPVLAVLLFSFLEWGRLARMHAGELAWSWGRGAWVRPIGHLAYFLLIPLPLLIIYSLFKNPITEYPSDFDWSLSIFSVVAIVLLSQGLLHLLLLRTGVHWWGLSKNKI